MWKTVYITLFVVLVYSETCAADEGTQNSFSIRFSPLTSLSLLYPDIKYIHLEFDYRFDEHFSMGPMVSLKDDNGYDSDLSDYTGMSLGWRQNIYPYGYAVHSFPFF